MYYWIVVVVVAVAIFLRVIKEYERGVLFTLGRFSGVMKPGLKIIIPVIQTWQKVDMRVKAVDVPEQDCMTKDNISVKVNAVIYYQVSDASNAILKVENFFYAVSQLAQTTMRNIVGEVELDELLAQREKISTKIKNIVDKATNPWGIKVDSVDLKDILLPEDMKRIIGKQAEAERERRAVIIKAEGEATAAKNLAKAADLMDKSTGALHLRTLQTLNNLSGDKSNTVIVGLPMELMKAFNKIKKE
jgi:regulator of protease activity HflC (stomatin/prohibitin superfamily)